MLNHVLVCTCTYQYIPICLILSRCSGFQTVEPARHSWSGIQSEALMLDSWACRQGAGFCPAPQQVAGAATPGQPEAAAAAWGRG